MNFLKASQNSISETNYILEKSDISDSEFTEEDVPEWTKIYNKHPGLIMFDNKYMDHIMFINNMIEKSCYENYVPLYQYGNSAKLYDLIIDQNPKLIKKMLEEAEEEFNKTSSSEDENGDDDNWKTA